VARLRTSQWLTPPPPPGAIGLAAPFELTHDLADAMQAFRAIGSRQQLLRSQEYRAHADEVDRVTNGMAYGRPTTPASPRSDCRFLRVAAWNVERGRQLSGIKRYLESHPQLRDADILLLPEVDVGMARSGNAHVAREIAETLGFEWVFGNSYLCLSYKKALWAEVDTPLGELLVAVVHLDSGTSPARRALQLEDLLLKMRQPGHGERAVVGGDFNTTTYDLQTVPRLLWNLGQKLMRGGFAHAIRHYLEPYLLYERPIFDQLERYGFEYQSFNAPGVGTTRYEVDTFASESAVRDYLPQPAVWALRRGLAPWNGVAPLKIDWITARGVRPLSESEVREDGGGRISLSPVSWEKPSWHGRLLSDHDPLSPDIALLPRLANPSIG
jgi:hypothetical protein